MLTRLKSTPFRQAKQSLRCRGRTDRVIRARKTYLGSIGVWASIRHGQYSGASVLQGEVFIYKITFSNTYQQTFHHRWTFRRFRRHWFVGVIYIYIPGKVTTLTHEAGDDPVKRRTSESKALFTSALYGIKQGRHVRERESFQQSLARRFP